jgi:hypothetical protein
MPQFDMGSRMDVGSALSRAAGITAASRGGGKAMEDTSASEDNSSNPSKLAYWVLQANGRKNAAYTMWKKYKRGGRTKGGNL